MKNVIISQPAIDDMKIICISLIAFMSMNYYYYM